uniref:Uncharacterized protein n=1 Tax=Anopheles culicifacies TaxID=139723 RepID=A0A182LWE3_9DIPT
MEILRSSSEVGVDLDEVQEERHTSVHRWHTDRAASSRSERHNTNLEASTILDSQRATGVTVAGRATTVSTHAHVLGLNNGGVPTGNTVSIGHDWVAGEHHNRRSGTSIGGASKSRDGSGHSTKLTSIGASWQTSRLDAIGEGDRRVQTDNGDVVADVGRGVSRMGTNSSGRESNALLGGLLNVTVTGTGGEVAQQSNLVRELTGRSFLTVDDTVGRNELAVDLHFRWQTGPVVIEFIDRAHLRPIDIDPFGAGNGQETNKKHEGFHPYNFNTA